MSNIWDQPAYWASQPAPVRKWNARRLAGLGILAVLLVAMIAMEPRVFGPIAFTGLFIGVYLLPTLVATVRKSHLQGPVTVVNLFLGWTFIGWVVALAMAVKK
ncbi:hypothetical protein PBI_U2_67 [Mycobacterium phage U2]|uniref:Superinfection immunity protein n=1 Tax=Mycobacterium phage U2 TaxID=260120 RepID=Q5J5N8_9CAUD|nr:hypothetical protein PBI_U2_67 [Mycobacterium phage U2]AAR89706.1 hypothetical protein PBI_U2_67 [Mycobacterium phage U2]QGJ88558.1 membrane protein [Mycobacterium phage Kanely]WAB09930.1 Imm-like superinfection immunity protein [Mycobacterium phage Altman]